MTEKYWIKDWTYCARKDCPNLNCSYHAVSVPKGEIASWGDRYKEGECPKEALDCEVV